MERKELSRRQSEIFRFVVKGKTYDEIGQLLGCSKSTVKRTVHYLRDNGLLRNPPLKGMARAWKPTEAGRKALDGR